MFGRLFNYCTRNRENKLVLPVHSEAPLTPAEFIEKFENDVNKPALLFHCLLKSLGLMIIGGGVVAGVYIVHYAQYQDDTRDKSEETGCYDSCGIDSVFKTWLPAGLEGIGACIVCALGGLMMAINPSYRSDATLLESLPSETIRYVNEFLSQNPTPGEPILTIGQLRNYCAQLQNERQPSPRPH